MPKMSKQQIIQPILFIFFGAVLRLLPHPPNIAPITSMALFGGIYLGKKYALIIPLVALFISDIFLGFYSSMIFVYGSFFVIGCLGLFVRQYKSLQTIFIASLIASVIFYLITNFGVWITGDMYPRTLHGLLLCYTLAIPFFRNTIVGDILYAGFFFSAYTLGRRMSNNFFYANLYEKRR